MRGIGAVLEGFEISDKQMKSTNKCDFEESRKNSDFIIYW